MFQGNFVAIVSVLNAMSGFAHLPSLKFSLYSRVKSTNPYDILVHFLLS